MRGYSHIFYLSHVSEVWFEEVRYGNESDREKLTGDKLYIVCMVRKKRAKARDGGNEQWMNSSWLPTGPHLYATDEGFKEKTWGKKRKWRMRPTEKIA